jgi:diaminopimelate decarboxylase
VNKADKKHDGIAHFCGPLCFSGDIIRRNCKVPALSEGDMIAILNVGAYCQSAASTFNAYPRPATLLLANGNVDVIQREESIEDITKRDVIPERLL